MPKKSPPPPDYTAQKAQFAATTSADRQKQATDYNTQVSDYNSSLANILSEAQSLNTGSRQYGIIHDEQFAPTRQRVDSLSAQLNALAAPTALAFGSTAESPWGPVSVENPTLNPVNSKLSAQIQGLLQGTTSQIDNLATQRTAEERRIQEALNSGRAGLSSFQNSLGVADIGNKAGLEALRTNFFDMENKANSFSSDILSEYGTDDFTALRNQLGQSRTQLDDLFGRRTAELNNVRQYEQGLNNMYDTLSSSVSSLGIGDISQMDAYEQQLRNKITEANRFSAPVEFDLSQELPGLQGLLGEIGNKRSQRQAELDRISAFQERESNDAFNLLSQANSANYYNGSSIAQLQQELAKNRRDLSGFSSVLDSDFGNANSQLSEAEALIQQLGNQRNDALTGFNTKAQAAIDKLNGYDLSDESGLRSGMNEAQALMAEMSRFTGNDIDPYRQQVQEAVNLGNKRLGDLSSERQAIEAQARNLLNTSRSNQYSSFSQLDSLAEQLAAISTRQTNFNAVGASDEIDAINALIGGERNRIQSDLDAAEAARLQELEATQSYWGPQGNNMRFSGMGGQMPWLTDAQRRSIQNQSLPSSFARQLQILYA